MLIPVRRIGFIFAVDDAVHVVAFSTFALSLRVRKQIRMFFIFITLSLLYPSSLSLPPRLLVSGFCSVSANAILNSCEATCGTFHSNSRRKSLSISSYSSDSSKTWNKKKIQLQRTTRSTITTVANTVTRISPSLLHSMTMSTTSNFVEGLFTQVISDVDDTLKSSGGVAIAGIALGGIDVQYERGEIYPGVVEFMLQLSLYGSHCYCNYISDDNETLLLDSEGSNQTSKTGGSRSRSTSTGTSSNRSSSSSRTSRTIVPVPAKVVIVTARAKEFKFALEIKENNPLAIKFRTVGERNGIQGWGIGPVLYGSVVEWLFQDRKGLRKFTNFERLIECQQPHYQQMQMQQRQQRQHLFQYIYVGDTGEYDQQAGEWMLREYPDLVKAVFLHVVYGKNENSKNKHNSFFQSPLVQTNRPSQQQHQSTLYDVRKIPPPIFINGRPIIFFRTYVGAAISAVQYNFMSVQGLRDVIESACTQLQSIPKSNSKWIDLNHDIDLANKLL